MRLKPSASTANIIVNIFQAHPNEYWCAWVCSENRTKHMQMYVAMRIPRTEVSSLFVHTDRRTTHLIRMNTNWCERKQKIEHTAMLSSMTQTHAFSLWTKWNDAVRSSLMNHIYFRMFCTLLKTLNKVSKLFWNIKLLFFISLSLSLPTYHSHSFTKNPTCFHIVLLVCVCGSGMEFANYYDFW